MKIIITPLSDSRTQGYDDADNIAGKYEDTHANIEEQNYVIIFS